MKKFFKTLVITLITLLIFISSLLVFTVIWFRNTWDEGLGINEILFQLELLEGTGGGMFASFALKALLPAVILTAAIIIIRLVIKKKEKRSAPFFAVSTLATFAAAVFAGIVIWNQLGIGDYYGIGPSTAAAADDYVPPVIETIDVSELETAVSSNDASASDDTAAKEVNPWADFMIGLSQEMTPYEPLETSDFVKNYYVDPSTVQITFPEQKRNLIYIILESMEVTYADPSVGGGFEENLIPNITSLAQENENFTAEYDKGSVLNGAYAYNGSNWTVGSMFGQTSGLPLQTGSIGRNQFSTQDHFYPTATLLGDILNDAGYRQMLFIGSKATFAGRDKLFTDHGSYEIRDYDYAKEKGLVSDYIFWGYDDQKLFSYAKDALTEMSVSSNGQPFNFTMLTVDTHFPNGYVCDLCEKNHGDQYSNVISCSDKQIYDFVKWIQAQDFYENTTIIIQGDHPTMNSTYCNGIPKDYKRKVYTCVINAPVAPVRKAYREYCILDMFPTTLSAIGAEVKGGRLGLGTSLYTNQLTLTEQLGYDTVSRSLNRYSGFLAQMADIKALPKTAPAATTFIPMNDGSVAEIDENGNILRVIPADQVAAAAAAQNADPAAAQQTLPADPAAIPQTEIPQADPAAVTVPEQTAVETVPEVPAE